jgi:L-ascorbate metabolism protein UlaG (beta-lactamase superfamily)
MFVAIIAGILLVLVSTVIAGYFFLSAPGYKGPVSDHFDGKKFFNSGSPRRNFSSVWKWMLTRKKVPWPSWIEAPFAPAPPARVTGNEVRITFVNHASFLIQCNGLNILTDPVWSMRVSPFSFAGPKRHRPPGIRLEDLPPLDLVLLSHNHYDHMDEATLKKLFQQHSPKVFTGLGNRALLHKMEIPDVTELDWWDHAVTHGLTITAVPAKHSSGRGISDQETTLWLGFVLETPQGTIYFAGDSGYGSHFKQIGEKLGPMRISMIPIGAYVPQWFMNPVHMSPDEAVKAHRDVRSQVSVAMHFGTFSLADEGEGEAEKALRETLQKGKISEDTFCILPNGANRTV